MLKLERKSRDGQVNILVRDKEYLFNRSLMAAFGVALGMHVLFFVLFNVSPIRIAVINTLFPPVHVETEAHSKDLVITADLNPVMQTIHGIPLPEPSKPEIDRHPEFLTVRPSVYVKEAHPSDNTFLKIEAEIYQPELAIGKGTHKQPLAIVVSGLLADKPLTVPTVKIPTLSSDITLTYDVLVEGRTGKVFWFEPKVSTTPTSIDKLAEKILKDLTFTPDAMAFATAGEVELHFTAGAP